MRFVLISYTAASRLSKSALFSRYSIAWLTCTALQGGLRAGIEPFMRAQAQVASVQHALHFSLSSEAQHLKQPSAVREGSIGAIADRLARVFQSSADPAGT